MSGWFGRAKVFASDRKLTPYAILRFMSICTYQYSKSSTFVPVKQVSICYVDTLKFSTGICTLGVSHIIVCLKSIVQIYTYEALHCKTYAVLRQDAL